MLKSKLTPKENYLCLLHGKCPEYLPLFTMGFPGFNGETGCRLVGPSLFNETHVLSEPNGREDIWGVKYIANMETNYALIPEPNNFILDDITRWHDILKTPVVPDGIDWEKLAADDIKKAAIDRSQTALMTSIGLMPFQQLVALMGFTEAFMAMFEEPEYTKELLHHMADVYLPIIEATLDYYQPDIMYFLDDTASANSPFISLEMFREILLPVYDRLLKPVRERGVPIAYHNCGKCELFLDDMLEQGVRLWDPAQPMNDLLAIKKKYGKRLALAGGYQWNPPITWPEYNEDEIRQSVYDCIDMFAPGGGFAFVGVALGRYGDEAIAHVNQLITQTAYNYGRDYYL